ncbi:MAG: hypothetical protein QOF48_3517, partial [Verrucomicrobiota bacterium]
MKRAGVRPDLVFSETHPQDLLQPRKCECWTALDEWVRRKFLVRNIRPRSLAQLACVRTSSHRCLFEMRIAPAIPRYMPPSSMSPRRGRWAVLPLLLALSLSGTPVASAFQEPAPALANFDRRTADGGALPRTADPNHPTAVAHLRALVPDARIEDASRPGYPVWVRSERGFLSGANGAGRGIPAASLQKHAMDDPARAAKAFLDEHRAVFGHGSEALIAARIRRDFQTPGTGVRTMIWEQEAAGIPVFEGHLVAHTTKRGELVSLSSRLHPDPERGSQAPGIDRNALVIHPPIDASDAVARAAMVVEEPAAAGAVELAESARADDPRRGQHFRSRGLSGEAKAQLTWLPLADGSLRLCWEVVLARRVQGETFRVLIDAQSGEAWVRRCLTKQLSAATYRVWSSTSPTPMAPGWPFPNTNQPPEAARALVTLRALDTNASPAGWIADGVNETLGNNVDAHLDLDGNNVVNVPRPHGTPDRVFDFPVNLALSPGANREASVVQAFYWCNVMHDRLYELGFTEAAGNFQNDNFGRGGLGGDAVSADAQDGSGFDNANFTTLDDGTPPRMQMFVFVGPAPDRDGSLDAGVILHEYTHGLTDRLVGGGAGLDPDQSAGMAEGWSDFYALSLLSQPYEDLAGTYPIGAYAGYLLNGNASSYYFGIRRYPYCTDMARNPLTFKDIDSLQASVHTGVPRNSTGGGAGEAHSVGEVWCSVLWDARARLIQRHGWTNGNQLMLQLVTDALVLTPANPNFLQARDAILQADVLRTAGVNRRDLWSAFAQRGMGAGATSPLSATSTGVREAFDVPDDLGLTPATGFIASGPLGGVFHPSTAIYSLTNLGTNKIAWSAQTTSAWLQLAPAGGGLAAG